MTGKEKRRYDHRTIESKWQKRWEEEGTYCIDLKNAKNPYYNLMMFPYPSAEGLHVGNVYAFTGSDIYGRYQRLKGFDVFEPIGFDAFGMHSENYSLQIGINPARLVPQNVRYFRENQLIRLGAMFDWSHEVNTTSPDYYKWTQWIFTEMFRNDLAYRKTSPVNWCPSCKTVLADEQVIGGVCERCESLVTQREMEQWYFRITKYAQKLLDNHKWLDWSEITKNAQINWIGRSEGTDIDFPIEGHDLKLTVFTTRPDTVFGATYMVLAPEHPFVEKITTPENKAKIEAYIKQSKQKTEIDRQNLTREKTGEFTGAYAINPVNCARIPIWVADYVIITYGTGAIMAVPAHDTRDFEFAQEFKLLIKEVISPDGKRHDLSEAYTDEGIMVNSGEFDGIPSLEAIGRITDWLSKRGAGERKIQYRLRDWCVSRQRYWGVPIPIIYCDGCGPQAVPTGDLPVLLPELEEFQPDGSGKAPLGRVESFVNTTCPACGGKGKREVDVLDNFLDSAWYFLRYPSTHRDDIPMDPDITKKWLPVDMYIGGNEHAVLHLLYTRFVIMALKDMGYIDFDEPFKRFRAHGLIIRDGDKMSKSKGNVVNPNAYFDDYGADTFRTFLMFIGPYQEGGDFRDKGITGPRHFLERVYNIVTSTVDKGTTEPHPQLKTQLHQTIKKVSEDIENLKYNTAIAAMMEFTNFLTKHGVRDYEANEALVKLIAPFAPHLAEELWEITGHKESIFNSQWPAYDPDFLIQDTITLVIQVNGKVRANKDVPAGLSDEEMKQCALKHENIGKWIEGKTIRKMIVVRGKLVNIVVS